MRKYAYLIDNVKNSSGETVAKIMLYESGEGVYLFEYSAKDAEMCTSDRWYDSPEEVYEEWNGLVDERGWIDIEDPLPGCQHDAFIPIRVKGRDAGRPEWGKFETLKDGQWVDYCPEQPDLQKVRERSAIIDITQELFSCRVYPGDMPPERLRLADMDAGDDINLSGLTMCAHNGTHIDAPSHFIRDGLTVDRMGLEPFVGDCFVARHDGDVTGADAVNILEDAGKAGACRRILIAGRATVTEAAAAVFAEAGLLLLGNESQTVGPEDAPKKVHMLLLGSGCALLEGVVLDGVAEGRYFLNAAPLNLGGCEGAPCRAYLIDGRLSPPR